MPYALLPGHLQRKNPRGHAAQPPCLSWQTGTWRMLAGHPLLVAGHLIEYPGQGNVKAPPAAQETPQTLHGSRRHCLPPPPSSPVPNPALGSVLELAAPWLQEKGINGLSGLQQPRGIDRLGCPRPGKLQVTHGSLSLLPSMGLPRSHPSHQGKQRGSDASEAASSSQALPLPARLPGDFSSPGQV